MKRGRDASSDDDEGATVPSLAARSINLAIHEGQHDINNGKRTTRVEAYG